MAIGAITMILANVGLQIYNNWCGSRQNAALQQKREEFERAAKERNTEHMWRLLREGQEIALQLENEKHADRLKELKDEVDHLLEKLTYETTISNWPLKVLPIVMKNQAFGNLLANQEENVAMHVIFTRSNHDKFNKLVYPVVEKQLEQYCDKHWSTMTDHPILFYSGAWKPAVTPTDVQVMAMREELKNLPTLLITPFFRPNDGKLVFQLHMWGVGANSTDKFDVPEIEPTDFQRSFNNQDDYDNEEGLLDEIVEDLVPYLECIIGYMADTYFWSSAGLAPHLPLLLTSGAINTDGMRHLVDGSREYYSNLLTTSEEKSLDNIFLEDNLLNLYEGSSVLWDVKTKVAKLEEVFYSYCRKKNPAINGGVLDNAQIPFMVQDLSMLNKYKEGLNGTKYEKLIKENIQLLNTINFDFALLDSNDILELSKGLDCTNGVAEYRLGEIFEFGIENQIDVKKSCEYYKSSKKQGFVLALLKLNIDQTPQFWNLLFAMKNHGIEQALYIESLYYYNQKYYSRIIEDANMFANHQGYLMILAISLIENNKIDSSLRILSSLSDRGHVEATERLLQLYKDGSSCSEDAQLYAQIAKKAMFQNSAVGTYSLAMCYLDGYGIEQNTNKAIIYLNKSAEMGYSEAIEMYNLLTKYRNL
ncbi:tetratricopeptide repeat protein [Prevotella pectinovora]|uniref:tetratricopeptide repeat protein n=1 Tax=Prevotella pectinovora TaxID=1602169 RepID=UPI0035202959